MSHLSQQEHQKRKRERYFHLQLDTVSSAFSKECGNSQNAF